MKKQVKNIEIGERFDFGGYNWTKLEDDTEGGTLVIMTDIMCRKAFDENGCNEWSKSSLREYLNLLDGDGELMRCFREHGVMDKCKLDIETNLLPIISHLIAADCTNQYYCSKDYIALLSWEMYRKYREIIPQADEWYWTLTPCKCSLSLYSQYARAVNSKSEEDKGDYDVRMIDGGVRPVCRIKSKIYVNIEGGVNNDDYRQGYDDGYAAAFEKFECFIGELQQELEDSDT